MARTTTVAAAMTRNEAKRRYSGATAISHGLIQFTCGASSMGAIAELGISGKRELAMVRTADF